MEKKYSQKFRSELLTNDRYKEWLQREGDNSKCRCKYCKCVFSAKLSDVEIHHNTAKHKASQEPFSAQRRNVIPFPRINSESVKQTEASLALFIASHCAISLSDHLSDLCKSGFCDSKNFKDLMLRRTKCSAITCNVLAPHFRED